MQSTSDFDLLPHIHVQVYLEAQRQRFSNGHAPGPARSYLQGNHQRGPNSSLRSQKTKLGPEINTIQKYRLQ